MKVALISTLPGGGPVTQSISLAQGLRERGVQVRAVVAYESVAARFEDVGVDVVHAPFGHWLDPGPVRQLWRAMSGMDVVHAHDPRGGLWLRLRPATRQSPVKVQTAHGVPNVYFPEAARPREPSARDVFAYRMVDPTLSRLLDMVVVPSRAVARDLVTRFRYPPDRVTVIPNGIEIEDPPHFGDPTGTVTTLSVHEPYKGLDVFLNAVALVVANRSDGVRFAMPGTGSESETLAHLAHRLGIADRVDMPGLVAPHAALESARIFVMSSRWENAPIALLEAMAAGVPVVSTDAVGIPEIATLETAVVIPTDDAGAMARAIERLLDDPVLGRQLAGNARRRVETHFTAAGNVSRILALYEQLTAGRRAESGAR